MIAVEGGVCSARFPKLQFLTEPLCDCCGRPLSGAALSGEATALIARENAVSAEVPPRCVACLSAPPPYDWMRASFTYNASSEALVLALKYRNRLDVVPSLSRWMALVSGGLIAEQDLLMPSVMSYARTA